MIESLGFALQGLQKTSLNVAKAADNIANPQRGTEIVEDIIDIKINANNFKANALVVEVTKDLQDDLYKAFDKNV
jgi:hypothetical protein